MPERGERPRRASRGGGASRRGRGRGQPWGRGLEAEAAGVPRPRPSVTERRLPPLARDLPAWGAQRGSGATGDAGTGRATGRPLGGPRGALSSLGRPRLMGEGRAMGRGARGERGGGKRVKGWGAW